MLKTVKTSVALTVGALALGVLGAAPSLADDQDPKAGTATANETADHTQEAQPQPGSAAEDEQAAAWARHGRVVSRAALNVRAEPTTRSRVLGSVRSGAKVALACKVRGQNVLGNDIWYKLDDRKGWLTARYVRNLDTIPWCR
ncbi:SH3 domain-containing protein [Streptomyces sp. TRM 70351]|uniref:SH3 domain-containing protein n=1 Tax=Streptomyces sp. TRM 70351 TaxID=3116552 RepID=UPI002E7BADF9|nr:SH3 domain-containing protein [Streptomyces sp. TRM 70351]MEE1929261.1 SH3 domain-containing protein [Streptomyces sp. TRM 70351]